jgi:hypothetical protein
MPIPNQPKIQPIRPMPLNAVAMYQLSMRSEAYQGLERVSRRSYEA